MLSLLPQLKTLEINFEAREYAEDKVESAVKFITEAWMFLVFTNPPAPYITLGGATKPWYGHFESRKAGPGLRNVGSAQLKYHNVDLDDVPGNVETLDGKPVQRGWPKQDFGVGKAHLQIGWLVI